MNVARYRFNEVERHAVRSILARVHQIVPDALVTPAAGVATIYTSRALSSSAVAHWLRLSEYPRDLAPLRKVSTAIARLTQSNATERLLILEGLPIDSNPPALLFLFASMLGELREYIGHGAPVVEVSDKSRIVDQRPSSDNNLMFDLHSDMTFHEKPPSFVCFLVLNQGASGGESIFCDLRPIMTRLSRETIEALQRPFSFPAPPHQPNQRPQFFPILHFVASGIPNVRYRRDRLEPLDQAQERALVEFEREIHANAIEITLLSGQMAVYSNTQLLHGRRQFRDAPTRDQIRRALRAYADNASTVTTDPSAAV